MTESRLCGEVGSDKAKWPAAVLAQFKHDASVGTIPTPSPMVGAALLDIFFMEKAHGANERSNDRNLAAMAEVRDVSTREEGGWRAA